jgi:polyphosphate kinase 2
MKKLKRKQYDEAIKELHAELIELQRWIIATGQRVVIVFEGRDAAGKGGVIKAIEAPLNNRHVRTVALSRPTSGESGQWYFQRYVEQFPTRGELVLFDRSWYNRAGVEHVMGYCTDEEYRQFLIDCPTFERLITADGTLLIKYWLAVDQEQQEDRFAERAADPQKRWKLSPVDIAARAHYAAYGEARDVMLKATHTEHAPWFVVDFNDQRRGRLNLIRHLLDLLPQRAPSPAEIALDPLPGKLIAEKIPRAFRIKAHY